jgi:3-phenylpropionate/trans-cinnamate dioxygenase ferredoxin reductase component
VLTLRRDGYDGRIVLVGEESQLPYERPALSKEVLTKGLQIEDILTVSQDWYVANGVETATGVRASEVRPRDGAVVLADGRWLASSGVLLATGAIPRRLPFEENDRVRYLRNYEDARAIYEWLRPGSRVIVIGAGFIGAEVAASAFAGGADVVMLEMLDSPFSRVLGDEIGRTVAEIHRDKGVDLRTGERVVRIETSSEGVLVTTSGGAHIEANVVVVGVGILPNDAIAQVSGIRTSDGILVDAGCATSAEKVFAAGDVVRQTHPMFGSIRVEHYDSAIKQGSVAARNLVGGNESHTDAPWFWSDQYEHNLQYAGYPTAHDRLLLRGSPEDQEFSAFFLDHGRLAGCFGLNRGGDVRIGLRMLGADLTGVVEQLGDESVSLRTVLKQIAPQGDEGGLTQ